MTAQHGHEHRRTDDPAIIYLLVVDPGNRRVLTTWVEEQDSYALADDTAPLTETDCDLCIVDRTGLQRHEDQLRSARSDPDSTIFPVLLLDSGDQRDSEVVPNAHHADPTEAVVDEILTVPVRQTELNWRIQSLLRLYEQANKLANYAETIEHQRDDLELLNEVVRHDIRNHLQLVTAYADMLDGHVDKAGESHRKQILESANNAIALTGSARDLAEVILQSTAEETERVSLAPVLDGQIESVRAGYEDAEIRMEGSIPNVEVVADERLESVFRNLLTNAIQHNDKAVPEVTVSAERDDDTVTVRIADNGRGVPDAQKDEIFGRGEKGLDSAGTGIGLYLVRSLVDRYGGDVWVEDNDPEGAIFVVGLRRV